MAISFAVAGAAGRMGRRVVALATNESPWRCTVALETTGSPYIGADAGELAGVGRNGVIVADRATQPFDVLLDFSTPEGTMQALEICRAAGTPIVIGTTGHDAMALMAIERAAERIAVFRSPNMSVGVNVVLQVVQRLAKWLDESYDIEIVEAHHRFKADAPSGTALALRDAVIEGRRREDAPAPAVIYGRHGRSGERPAGEIAVHALRLGDVVGRHVVSFGAPGETISIEHVAHSRDTFAAGALRAASWMVGRPAGLYDMHDVLFAGPSA